MKLPDKMTTEELANLTGMTRQTVNRWIKKYVWQTENQPGVKGGRARYILMTDDVLNFVMKMPAMHEQYSYSSLTEPAAAYLASYGGMHRVIKTLQLMTADEMHQFDVYLARVGLYGFLSRLGIKQKTTLNEEKTG